MVLSSLLVRVKVETITLVEIENIINKFSLGILREFYNYRGRQDVVFNTFYDLLDSCSLDEVNKSTLTECDELVKEFSSLVDIKINNMVYNCFYSLQERFGYLKYTSIDLDKISLEINNILTMIRNQYVVCLKLEVNNFMKELGDRARILGLDYYQLVDVVDTACDFIPYYKGVEVTDSILLYNIDKIKLYLPQVSDSRFNYINLIFRSKIIQFYLEQNNHIFDI